MNKKKYIFDVSNMKCGGCVSAVQAALDELGGTESIEVSLEENKAVVLSEKSAQDIINVLTGIGFPATEQLL